MSPVMKQKLVAAAICCSFGAVIVGAAMTFVIGFAEYLYHVRLAHWPFCASGACLGIAAVSVKRRISLAIATTVLLSLVASVADLAIEYMIGSLPGPMTDARISALYLPVFANAFLAMLVPMFHRPFHECKSRFWRLILNKGR